MNRYSILLSILVALLLRAHPSAGQTNTLDIGAAGGISSMSLRVTHDPDKHYQPRLHYSGGLFVQYNFKKIFSLRTDVFFERKGGSVTIFSLDSQNAVIVSDYYRQNLDYVTIPLLLRASFGKKIRFFINAGPYAGILLRHTTVRTEGTLPLQKTKTHQTGDFKNLEAGISAGIGLSYPLHPNFGFSLEVRDNVGLTNISTLPVAENGIIKTNSFNILLSLYYKLGQRRPETKRN